MKKIRKIVSGGQTGADRAAFDFALENNIRIGGFVPKNRLAENGKIPAKYTNLIETAAEDYAERTELNVKNSDATLILSHGELKGGSLLTQQFAQKHKKPHLHIDFSVMPMQKAAEKTQNWLDLIECEVLNVAGGRASEDPKIYEQTKLLLQQISSLFIFSGKNKKRA